MHCPKCGKEVDESDVFCRACGCGLSADKPSAGEPLAGTAAPRPGALVAGAIRRSGEATASLILGLFSFIPVVGLLAVIFGHLARASIRRSGGRLLGDGMALFGLALGYVSLGVWVIIGLWALVNPYLLSNKSAAGRNLTVLKLRTMNTAASTYAVMYEHGYPPSLAAMGPPKPGIRESAEAVGFIPETDASGQDSAYRFTYVAGKADKGGRIGSYALRADPIKPGETIHFFTDETGLIRQERGKEASAQSVPYQGLSDGQPAASYNGGLKEKPQWEFAEHLSPMDETKTESLRMEAVGADVAGYATGTLMIRCKGGKTDLYVITGMPAEVEYGTDTNTVRIRLDDRKPATQHWTESDDHEALFAPDPIALAQEIAGAQTMLFEFTPFQQTKKLIRFDLQDLKTQIEKVATPCKWSEIRGAVEEGNAAIISWPQGALVSIDGEGWDESLKTPVTVSLKPGRHQINITKVGFLTSGKQVLIRPGETTQVEVTLEKMPY